MDKMIDAVDFYEVNSWQNGQHCDLRLEKVLAAITSVGQEVARIPDLKRILQLVIDKAADTMPMDAGVIFVLDESLQRYRAVVAYNLPSIDLHRITFGKQEGVPGWVVTQHQPLIIPDARTDARVHPYVLASGICSVMAVPLIVHERVVGVLNFFARKCHAFQSAELHVAQIYANQAAIFVHNAQLLEELRAVRDSLEANVEERTAQLREAQANALRTEKFAVAGRLAAAFAHEINNPLQAILLHLQTITDGVDLDSQRALPIIEHELSRISGIVRRLLDIQSPKTSHFTWHDSELLIEEVLTLLAAQLHQASIIVDWQCAASLPSIWVDGNQLKQVLINLILNATDAMPKGGTLCLAAIQQQDDLIIKITDTGIGMNDFVLSQIFEPFFSTKSSGTGLGLPVSLEIITAHGGTLTAQSLLNQGTTFCIQLPISYPGFEHTYPA